MLSLTKLHCIVSATREGAQDNEEGLVSMNHG